MLITIRILALRYGLEKSTRRNKVGGGSVGSGKLSSRDADAPHNLISRSETRSSGGSFLNCHIMGFAIVGRIGRRRQLNGAGIAVS